MRYSSALHKLKSQPANGQLKSHTKKHSESEIMWLAIQLFWSGWHVGQNPNKSFNTYKYHIIYKIVLVIIHISSI